MKNRMEQATLRAITNNQNWCQRVAEIHQVKTKLEANYWCSKDPMPTFFPNLVTLNESATQALLEEIIPVQGSYFVKDCFAALSLDPLGFTKLFDANWYIKTTQPPLRQLDGVQITEATSAEGLAEWEARWRGEENYTPIYPSSVLDSEAVRFFTAESNEQVAGITSFNDTHTLGIYNLWGEPSLFSALIGHLQMLYPNQEVVGYGDEQEVQRLEPFGFEILTPLTVWGRFA
ncbi:hypothetical protein OPW33_06275 [Vibrio europaeus]|uniref:hypothetical protein n=1 Tax=Vibrio europaeus TaxID=300876 RepID=UPI002340BAEA|nr:hypothetical protein [Vibrio europaeus]MDC5838934.1 hypothetical protein [Vibrio europaeus]